MKPDEMPLGRWSDVPRAYDPALLYPVSRSRNRRELDHALDPWPWYGEDRWQAWELSWLRADGRPRVAVGEFRVPVNSPYLIESKSLKLYLNSLNNERFESRDAFRNTLVADLSAAAGAAVDVSLFSVDAAWTAMARPPGASLIDDAEAAGQPQESPLERLRGPGDETVSETLCSHLLRSLCPVTGQPDWGTLLVAYEGPRISKGALLDYILGLRETAEFHEQCVERIFHDLHRRLAPTTLRVAAWYTRRGGLDINPWRSTHPGEAPSLRLRRQ